MTTTEAPTILSLARLRKCRPCDLQFRTTTELFPDGIPLTVAAMTELAEQSVDYWWGVNVLLLASGRKTIARLALGATLAVVARELEDNGDKANVALAEQVARLLSGGSFHQLAAGIQRLHGQLRYSFTPPYQLLYTAERLSSHPDEHNQLNRHWEQLNEYDGEAGTLVLQAALDLIAGRLRQEG